MKFTCLFPVLGSAVCLLILPQDAVVVQAFSARRIGRRVQTTTGIATGSSAPPESSRSTAKGGTMTTTRLYAAAPRQDEQGEEAENNDSLPSSRRDFFGQVAAVGAAISSSLAIAVAEAAELLTAPATETSSSPGRLALPPMGLGAWSWGDSLFWGYDKKNDDELRKVFNYAVENRKKAKTSLLLDTAELYGFGRSERLIGEFSKSYDNSQIQVATKFAPLPWCTKAEDVVRACEKSVQRLDNKQIDLYQIHFPNAYSNAEYWDGLAMAYEKGLVKAVGVSNYGVDAVRACHDALAKRGIPLATNQIQMSLLYRWPLENGLKQACDDLGIQILSYSPLALGMLTGKYTKDNKPSGPRSKIYDQLMSTPDYENLLSVMQEVADGHQGKSANKAQVALNWARAKGTIPIPGARTVSQVQSNYNALDWSLSPDEVKVLDEAAAKVPTFLKPENNPFPRQDKDTGLVMYDS